MDLKPNPLAKKVSKILDNQLENDKVITFFINDRNFLTYYFNNVIGYFGGPQRVEYILYGK